MATEQDLFNDYLKKVEALKAVTDFYEYEKQFVALHEQFGRQVFEKSLEQKEARPVYKKKFGPATER